MGEISSHENIEIRTKTWRNFFSNRYKYITLSLIILFAVYLFHAIYCPLYFYVPLVTLGILGILINIPLGVIGCWNHSKWFLILHAVVCGLLGIWNLSEFVLAFILTFDPDLNYVPLIVVSGVGIIVWISTIVFVILVLKKRDYNVTWINDYESLSK